MKQEDKILRVIDANFNRCKEGLRVCEDIFRFILEDDSLRRRIRQIRHGLDAVASGKIIKTAAAMRDSISDLGRNTDALEFKRKNYDDLVYINLQRTKESLRVLEECFKIVDKTQVKPLKALRYRTYTMERDFLLKK